MSSCRRSRTRAEGGFSLIEIVVAMGLLSIVLIASLPMFLAMLKSTVVIKQQTQAKNLTQERLEQVRDLRFHVANQNGPYLDLLDVYYTDARLAYARPSVVVGSDSLAGQYVSSGGGTNGEPMAPYYRVTIGSLPGATGFSQVVTTQFLEADGKTVLPAARFAAYNSQLPGVDAPPSQTVGVTVITKWTEAGRPKSYRTYTQVTETRPEKPVIQSQARAVAVEVGSTAADGTSLALQAGIASLDGSQSSGSAVSGYAGGALARRTGQPVVEGMTSRFQLPSQPVLPGGTADPQTPTDCSWYGFGSSSVDNVSASIANGLPRSPTNVDDVPRKAITGALTNNGANTCGTLSFTNRFGTGTARADAVGVAMGASPLVRMGDGTSGAVAVSGSAYVTATPLTTTPQRTYSGTRMVMERPVVLFPGSPGTGGLGLVTAQVTSATLDCTSGAPGSVAATYAVVLKWWGSIGGATATQHTATWTYDSATGTAPVLSSGSQAWNPQTTSLGGSLMLSDVVTGDAPAAVSVGGASGQRGFPSGILTLNTSSTLGNEAGLGFSAIKVQLGQLTCVADDER